MAFFNVLHCLLLRLRYLMMKCINVILQANGHLVAQNWLLLPFTHVYAPI